MTLFTRKNTYLSANVHLLHVDDLEIKKVYLTINPYYCYYY